MTKPPRSGPTAAAIAAAAPTSAYVFFCAAPSKLPWISDCIAGSSSDAPRPPMIAQKMMIAVRLCARVIARAPVAYARRPTTYALLRPNRSPILLLIRMNAAETRASSAIALWTELTVVSRSLTTAAIDTFISDVSTTRTNMAAASTTESRELPSFGETSTVASPVTTRLQRCARERSRDLEPAWCRSPWRTQAFPRKYAHASRPAPRSPRARARGRHSARTALNVGLHARAEIGEPSCSTPRRRLLRGGDRRVLPTAVPGLSHRVATGRRGARMDEGADP